MWPGQAGRPKLVTRATPEARAQTLFQAFGDRLVESDGRRREATETLADIRRETSEEGQAALDGSNEQYQSLKAEGRSFHSEYDEWRRTNGGCDPTKVRESLSQFTTSFSEFARQVRALPSIVPVLSLGEIFVEAAERQEVALRDLRDNWRPFVADVYQHSTGSGT